MISSEDENFGVRQEYHITISLLREVEEEKPSSSSSAANNESSAGGVENHSHNRFWVLNTRDVNAFTAAQLNRWLLCLEVLIGRVKAGEDGQPAASQEEQLINSVMVSTVV